MPLNNTESESAVQRGIKFADRERRRISGELHDNVASKLSIIRYKLGHSPHAIPEVLGLLDNVMFTVRTMSHGLHTPFIEKISFVDALKDFILPLHQVLDVEVHYFPRPVTVMEKQSRLHLFRIFQEVMNNILKHAHATHVWIGLHHSKKHLNLSVRDNGIGFAFSQHRSGLGLQNIQYRAKKLNAKYKFKPTKGGGTLFIISVPLTE